MQNKTKLIILSLIFSITCVYLINTQNQNLFEHLKITDFDNLQFSPAKGLNHDDHAEVHGYADQYVDWSFSTLPSQIINVWALEAFQYSLWTSGIPASGQLLSTSSSDSGRFYVPEGMTWYIVFWNDEIGSQFTIISYNGNFVGDSRPPSITVYKPYGSYRAGQTLQVDWSSLNAGSSVRIELYKGSTLHTTIVSSTPNDGDYEWTIPSDITPGTDYQIKVSSLSTSAEDLSNFFEIRDPNIFVIFFPNSTSSLSMGNYYDIKFENSEYVHEVNVSLYHNDEFVRYIETQRNNWGYYYEGHCPWNIPSDLTPSTNYSIHICDYEDSNANGFSDYFEITEHRGLNILDPTQLTKIQPNSKFTINWNSTGQVDYVRIELWRDMHYENSILISRGIILTISASAPNNGSFIWNVPTLPTGYDYYMEICSTTDSGCWTRSDEFYIGEPPQQAVPSYDLFIIFSSLFFISLIYLYTHQKKSKIRKE